MKLVALIAAAGVVLAAAQASAQDGAVGEKVFAKCRACHQVGESAKSAIGPKLNGLFGRKAGTVGGFNYSDANKQSGVLRDEASFASYIQDPRKFMPGAKMVFVGLKSDKEIADITAFLKQFGLDGKKR